MRKDIGTNIAEVREAQGKTQIDVADALNLTRQAISKWENGDSGITIPNIILIAEHLGVSCDKLLRGKEADNLEVHSQLGLEDRAIENLKRIVESHSTSGAAYQEALAVLNDVISSEAFGKLIFEAAAFRWAHSLFKEVLPQEEQSGIANALASPRALERAHQQITEKLNSFESDERENGNKVSEILGGAVPFISMYSAEQNSKREMDKLFAKALNG